MENLNQIRIVDIKKIDSIEEKKVINFKDGHDIKNLVVKISRDLNSVMFANKNENFLLTKCENNEHYNQNTISWMKGKIIREIVHAGESNFLLICCKDYDRDLDVQSSLYENFKISIKRRIEPNTISILDAIQLDEDEEDGMGS